jgi:DNA-directed RNA polymerase subunit RPC12/RpoP
MLYQVCEVCEGFGSVPVHEALPKGPATCPGCQGRRFVKVGVTTGQLERMVQTQRALQGDPGLPFERRREILIDLHKRVNEALSRPEAKP